MTRPPGALDWIATLLPPLVPIGAGALFLVGLPGDVGGVGLDGALRAEGAQLAITGHFVPSEAATEGFRIGSGPDDALRLTEADVAAGLAAASVHDRRLRWTHGHTDKSAAFWRRDVDTWAGVVGLPGAQRPLADGDRIAWADRPDTALAAIADACAGRPGPGTGAATLSLVDATGLWLIDRDDHPRTALLPALPGAARPLGAGELQFDGSDLWIAPTPGAPPSWLVADGLRRAWLGVRGAAVTAPVDAAAAATLGLARALPAADPPELAFGGSRVIKPDVYVRIDDGAPIPIGVTGASDPIHPAFHVFRRRAAAESAVPWVHALAGGDDASTPRVGRSPGFTGSLYACPAGLAPVPIGAATLGSEDVVLAGHTAYEVAFRGPAGVELRPIEPVESRVHLLASLSTGRLRYADPPLRVPGCRGPDGPRRLTLRGRLDDHAVGAAPIDPGTTVASLPLPSWARAIPAITAGGATVDLLDVCEEGGKLVVVADRVGAPWVARPQGPLASGDTLAVAGHTLRFDARPPLLEQVLPLVGFVPIVVAFVLDGMRRLRRTAAGAGPWLRHGPPALMALVGGLLVVGGLVQTRLAASPRLLGSPDYLHRHLITGVLAAAAANLAVDLAVHAREDDLGARLDRIVRHGRALTGAIAAWAVFDRVVFPMFAGSVVAHPAVVEQVDHTVLLVIGAAVAAWVVPWRWLLGRARIAADAARAAAAPRVDPVRARLAALPLAGVRDVLWRPGFGAVAIGAGLLTAGVFLEGGSRSLGGFDLKLAEFAAVPVGLGLARLLVGWGRAGSSWGRFAVPLTTLGWIATITGLVVGLYGLRGDLGPLMVLVPAIGVTVAWWVLPWTPRAGEDAERDLLGRVAVFGAYAALFVVALATLWALVPAIEANLSELPVFGEHVRRAVDRLETFRAVWWTEAGHWSTTAAWIAAGDFANERFVSNLHSDLAFVAVMQSFHPIRAAIVLAGFVALVGGLGALGASLLGRSEASWAQAEAEAKASDDRELRRRFRTEALPSFLDAGAVGTFAVFTAAYLAAEVTVHVGTCFDTLPQTGITLPWVSSGGSASVGFAVIVAVALGLVAQSARRV